MDFRTELQIVSWGNQINHADRIALMGSCFTEHITGFLRNHKFRVLENPHGILFNPVSIANAINDYRHAKHYQTHQLFQHQDLWYSWHHHGRFASVDAELSLEEINTSIKNAHQFLQQSQWVVITLGSAWVYYLKQQQFAAARGTIVANCHKVPATAFGHRLLSVDETVAALQQAVSDLKALQPGVQIIFTISPVRHAREGLVENNRSKAVLHVALNQLLQQIPDCHYFPAYELVIDDLRDYRFYAEDMVHPNYQATRYVWDKFRQVCIAPEAYASMDEAYKIISATKHKAMFPASPAHQQFLQQTIARAKALQEQYAWLEFEREIEILTAQVNT